MEAMSHPTLEPRASAGWWKPLGRQFLIAAAASAAIVLLLAWLTGLRQVMHAALLSIAAGALLPFAVIAGGFLLLVLLGLVAALPGALSGSGAGADHCWEFNPFTGRAFGDYFKKHPGIRERVFLSAKSRSTALAVMQEDLDRALADNETSGIDFFAVHGVDDIGVLTDDVRRWAEKAKKEGKIRPESPPPCRQGTAGCRQSR